MPFLDTIQESFSSQINLPINEILINSSFYPGAYRDGGLIKDINTNLRHTGIISHVYADYMLREDDFLDEFRKFWGYNVYLTTPVNINTIVPPDTNISWINNFRLEHQYNHSINENQFARWTIFERKRNFGEQHGPRRFSLLYLGCEALKAFTALYLSYKQCPRVIALIQPGMTYTDFRSMDGPFYGILKNNPSGQMPEYVYNGGRGFGYDNLGWEGYIRERLIFPYYTEGNPPEGSAYVYKNQSII